MSITDWLSAGWPVLLSGITLIIVLAQMHTRIGVVEEKVKTLFQIINEMNSLKSK